MKNAWVIALTTLWFAVVVTGLGLLVRYELTPGASGAVPEKWPADSRYRSAPARSTLLMFLHPRCPCSRASLHELEVLMHEAGRNLRTEVVFFQPGDVVADWSRTDSWKSAEAIPGVHVSADIDGMEARRFGAETSGHCVLYGENGDLLFQGGITWSRGHIGASPGRKSIAELVSHRRAAVHETKVFGCPLTDPATNPCEATCSK